MSSAECSLCSSTLEGDWRSTEDLSSDSKTTYKFLLFKILDRKSRSGEVCGVCVSLLDEYDSCQVQLNRLRKSILDRDAQDLVKKDDLEDSQDFSLEVKIESSRRRFSGEYYKYNSYEDDEEYGSYEDDEEKNSMDEDHEGIDDDDAPLVKKLRKKKHISISNGDKPCRKLVKRETRNLRSKFKKINDDEFFTTSKSNKYTPSQRMDRVNRKLEPLTDIEAALLNVDSLLQPRKKVKHDKEVDGLDKCTQEVREEILYAIDTLRTAFPKEIIDSYTSDSWDIALIQLETYVLNLGIKGETICFRCNKEFGDVVEKMEHKSQCGFTAPQYKCYFCNRKGKSESQIAHHIFDSHKKEVIASEFAGNKNIGSNRHPITSLNDLYQCKFCGLECGTEYGYWYHYYASHKKFRSHSCFLCSVAFSSGADWRRHFLVEHAGFVFSCPFCDKCQVSHVGSVRNHLRQRCEALYPPGSMSNDVPKKRFRRELIECELCHSTHRGPLWHAKHMFTQHGLAVEIECEYCSKKFAHVKLLDEHQKTAHITHSCHYCGKSFTKRTYLQNHVKSRHETPSTPQQQFMCEVCSKIFKRKEQLQMHMATHSDVRKYKCNICDAAFKWPSSLKCHTQAKHCVGSLANRKCNFCDKVFVDLGNWKAHQYTHMQEKPHNCENCGKGFIRRDTYVSHKKTCQPS